MGQESALLRAEIKFKIRTVNVNPTLRRWEGDCLMLSIAIIIYLYSFLNLGNAPGNFRAIKKKNDLVLAYCVKGELKFEIRTVNI